MLVLGPFLLLWEPKSYELARRPDAGIQFGKFFSLFAAMVLFVGVGLAGASREMVQVMTAREYWAAETVIPIVAVSYVLFGLDSIGRVGLLFHHKTKTVLLVVAAACALNILGNAVFISILGMVGAAWATLLTFAFLLVTDLRLSQRHLPIRFDWKRLGLLVGISIATVAAMRAVRCESLWLAVAIKATILAGYPVLLLVTGFFGSRSIGQLLGKARAAA